MKKKTNIFFGFLIAISAVFGLAFSSNITSHFAYAEGTYTITYNITSSLLDEGFELTTTTDTDGKVSSFATASKNNGYYLKGWSMQQGSTDVVTTDTVFTGDTTLHPVWLAKTYVYTISQNDDDSYLTVVGQTADGVTTYTLISTATSLTEALGYIDSDNTSSNPTVPSTLIFDNYILATGEQINIKKSLKISGNVSSANESAMFKITATSDASVTFENSTLTNNNFCTLIDITSTKNIALTLNTVSLSSKTDGSPAINTTSTTTIALAGQIAHTATSLYEHTDGIVLDLTNKTFSSTDMVKIAVDYQYDNATLADNIYSPNFNHIQIIPLNNLFKTHKYLENNGLTIVVRTSLNVDFNLDNGSLADGYIIPELYYKETDEPIMLPTANEIFNQYTTFDGWFGKIVLTEEQTSTYSLSSSIYYFDIISLNSYLEASGTLANLDTYFKTTLDEFSLSTAITAYQYSDQATNYNAWANFFILNNIKPTLVAKWNNILYTITFVLNNGEADDSTTHAFDEDINFPTPTKEGFTFSNWFKDEALTAGNEFTLTKMPAQNQTLYAGYTINQYTITFVKNNGESNSTTTQDYNSTIVFPTIEKEGHSFAGWYTDEDLTNLFSQTTIPAENLSIYAYWTRNTYSIILNTNGKGLLEAVTALYGDVATKPENPTFVGYTFHGWYTDTTYTTAFNFDEPTPARNRTAYAKWTVLQYKLTYVFNNGTANSTITKDFGSNIAVPTQPTRNGYSFAGWHTDSTLTTRFDFSTTMPAQDLILYAKWTQKTTIQLSLTTQTVEIDSRGAYKVPTNISGFTVQYLVNGQWQIETPKEVGVYDVQIFRAEDEYYAEFNQILQKGFTVTQKTLDISWLPITLLIVFIIEIAMVVVIKLLRKKKLTQTIIIQTVALPFGLIPKTQFVLTIITGVLAIFGFIYMIVELVKLHKTVPMKDEVNIKYDNRALIEKRGDKSQNASISSNVNDLLKKEGLYVHDYSKDDNYKIDDDIIGRADASYTGKISNKNVDEDEE